MSTSNVCEGFFFIAGSTLCDRRYFILPVNFESQLFLKKTTGGICDIPDDLTLEDEEDNLQNEGDDESFTESDAN